MPCGMCHKVLVVVNEGMLFGAAGGKVHGQTTGDCGVRGRAMAVATRLLEENRRKLQ